MPFKTTSDRIGVVIMNDIIEVFIEKMKKEWDTTVPNPNSRWKKVNPSVAANFLLRALDDLVAYLVTVDAPGPDKKATVIFVLGILFDHIADYVFPIWFWPIKSVAEKIIIKIIVSSLIDWLVAKYKSGSLKTRSNNILIHIQETQ